MTTYNEWLDQLDIKLDSIDQGTEAVFQLIVDTLSASRDWVQKCAPFEIASALVYGPKGATSKSLDHIGYTLSDLCDLYSDFQIVVDWDWVFDEGGINPDEVFKPISGGNGSGASFEVKQDGSLSLLSGPATSGNPTSYGQTGFSVPIEVSILGNDQSTTIYFGVDLVRQFAGSQIVTAILASQVRVADQPGLAKQARWTIEKEANSSISTVIDSTLIAIPQVTLLQTPPQIWSAWHDGNARLAGRAATRTRERQGFMEESPGGYPLGIRLQLGILTNEISAQVQAKGVRLFSGPTVTGPKSFSLTAGLELSKSVKIGPKSIAKARVKVSQNFTGSLIPSGSRLLVVVNPIGTPHRDVSIRPKIPLLTNWVEDIIEDFIDNKIPAINGITKSFPLSGVQDFNVWLSDQFIILGVRPF